MRGLLFWILFGGCVLGSFVIAAALGSVPKAELPRYRRMRGSFMGAGLGGLLSFFSTPVTGSAVLAVSLWLTDVLVKLGCPQQSVLEWSLAYTLDGSLRGLHLGPVLVGGWRGRRRSELFEAEALDLGFGGCDRRGRGGVCAVSGEGR